MTATVTEAAPDHVAETEHRVTPLELFFDPVFVFALTQVTAMMADDPTVFTLAAVAAVCCALIAHEVVAYREARARVRAAHA